MTTECMFVGGRHDGEMLVLTNPTKTLDFAVRFDGGFGAIRYIRQDEKINGKTVYRLENYEGEIS